MRIVVLDGHTLNPGDNPWDELAQLGELTVHDRTPVDRIVARAAGAKVVLTNKTPLSADTLAQLPELRMIGVLATGYNVVDIDAADARGIVVCNVPEYGADSVAQFTFALMLALCHRVERHSAAVHDGEWSRQGEFSFTLTPQVELYGRTLGIVGLGRIGRRVGTIAHAMGMRVLAHSRTRDGPLEGGAFAWQTLDEVFRESDVVTLHCPQTEQTQGMVNAARLSSMKRGAMLINTARGGLIDEPALVNALRDGPLAGVAIDVASVEPLPDDSPLLGVRNLLITPHMAWASLAARKRLTATAVGNVRAFLAGSPKHVVNAG